MNKNYYTAPTVRVVHINVKYHLLDKSITNASMSGDFSEELEMGGTTTSADSRRRSIWGDEDD